MIRNLIPVCIILFGSFFYFSNKSQAQMKTLSTGDTAPMFTAKGSLAGSEFEFSLKKALAKGPVVLYFFPSAYTGGCDIEAHTFATLKDEFTAAGTTIIGVFAMIFKG